MSSAWRDLSIHYFIVVRLKASGLVVDICSKSMAPDLILIPTGGGITKNIYAITQQSVLFEPSQGVTVNDTFQLIQT